MAKFDFEYIYEYSSLRYHKIIEAESVYEAYKKFDEHFMTDPSICVCDVNLIKNESEN